MMNKDLLLCLTMNSEACKELSKDIFPKYLKENASNLFSGRFSLNVNSLPNKIYIYRKKIYGSVIQLFSSTLFDENNNCL